MASACGMFGRFALQKTCSLNLKRWYSIKPPVRLGGKVRRKLKGKDYTEGLSFKEKCAMHQVRDPDLEKPINIGAPYVAETESPMTQRQQKRKNKSDPQLEYAARHREIHLDLDVVESDWLKEYGPHHIRTIADHYGIFKDLFNGAFFVPSKSVTIAYDYDEEYVAPVYCGSDLPPSTTVNAPLVEYEAEEDSLWTLLLTNPDGHLTDNSSEYVHWLIGNIPGNDVSSGEILCDYLQPFPPRGTGFHRFVFVLFRQSKEIDFSKYKRTENCSNLEERTFKTTEFYREFQDDLTPLGLNFFQAEWDQSVKNVYHNILNMQEPAFEYRHPPPYHPPQVTYAKRQPFDRYFDRYRDKGDLAEEVLRMKLSTISPFEENPKPPKYPFIHKDTKYKPTWLKKREELMVRRREQFQDLS